MKRLALSCLFAALLCAAAYISIPLGISPVPLTLANLLAVLAGLLLGPWSGMLAVGLYLVAGVLGLPVFAGGSGGLAHFASPSGGYLIGYFLAALISGLAVLLFGKLAINKVKTKLAWWQYGIASVLGFATILVVGALGLMIIARMGLEKALLAGVLPFIPGDALKVVLATLISHKLASFVASLQTGNIASS